MQLDVGCDCRAFVDVDEEPKGHWNRMERTDFGARLRRLLRGFALYVQARHQLLSLEAGEATEWVGRQAVRWIVGGALLFFGYGLALAGGVLLMSEYTGYAWWQICLMLAPAHIGAGAAVLWSARRWPASLLFEASRKEFEKDKQWLSNQSEDL